MPVGTAAAMKGVMPSELERTGCRLMLANTYHLGCQPGADVVEEIGGGVHGFMKWPNALLTDSGGFQMVSLSKLMVITEEGVSFQSPYAEEGDIFLSPERCMEIQVSWSWNSLISKFNCVIGFWISTLKDSLILI